MGACLGLALRYLRNTERGVFHGPAFLGLVAAFLMGISVPLSGSRACTILLAAMLAVAFFKGAPTVLRSLEDSGYSRKPVGFGIAIALVLAGWGAWTIAGDIINARVSKAKEQIAAAWAQGGLGARGILYHDTWQMAKERPLFGWGMGSFPSVFALYNTQVPRGDHIPVVYHDAHSDWLQSIAEIGFAGTSLIGAAVAMPFIATRKRRKGPIPFFIYVGLVLVTGYAWIEFPFGNVAVVLGWWLFFFCAIQYLRLSDLDGATRRAP
jgi:O-antigen ligase